jgi:hypothetical protein
LEEDLLAGFARALGVSEDDALRAYVRDGRGAPRGAARLVAWDANSIHAFVFDTTNATGIRGASGVLSGIDDGLRDGSALGLARGQVLFAGGGSGLAVVAAGEAEACKRVLHGIFARETRSATCTAADVPLIEGEDGFNERVRAAGRELGRQRVLTGPDAEPAVPFFALRCQVCGRRAAAHRPIRGEERRERPECEPCFQSIERGKKLSKGQREAKGFEEIADAGGKGFYAVLYLDGNGIGKKITGLRSPLDYAKFSRALRDVLRASFEGIGKRYRLGDRLQLPICGGDDLVAILPGEVAVPFTRDLLGELERAADADPSLRGEGIGAAAGVAIGKVSFPIRHLLSEAEALLVTAKRRAYGGAARSALSFAVVTDGSPRSETVEPERWARTADALLLSGRPYTLREFQTFSSRLDTIKNVMKDGDIGRTQLHALHAQALLGPRQLRNHVLYQIGRWEEWQQLVIRLGGGEESLPRDPDACADQIAPRYGERRVFDIADMIELLPHWEPKP